MAGDTETHNGQVFDVLKPEDRPQDYFMDGSDLRFEASEHGGAEPDLMPQAITITDAQGRWAVYVPLEINGKIVRPRPER
jgi:hypothetical protein